jgi:hypothetical protein
MSIHIIEGLPRHGKTTFAVLNALEWRAHWRKKNKDPRRIIANFPVNVPGVEYIENFMNMKDMNHCVFLIDEAYKWFGAHESKENAQFLTFFTEHGKDANTLYLIAHKAAMLDVSIRLRTAESIWHVKRLAGPNRWEEPTAFEQVFGWWALCTQWMPSDQTAMKTSKPIKTRFIDLRRLHGKFDTLTKIGRMYEGKNKSGAGLAASSRVAGQAASRNSILTHAGKVIRKNEWLEQTDLTGWGGHVEQMAAGGGDDELMDALRDRLKPSRILVPVLKWAQDGKSYERVMVDPERIAEMAKTEKRRELTLAKQQKLAAPAIIVPPAYVPSWQEDLALPKNDQVTKEETHVSRQAGGGPDLGELHGVRNSRGNDGGVETDASGEPVGNGNQSRFRVVSRPVGNEVPK